MVSKLFLVLSAVPLVAYFYLFHVRALPLTRVSQNGSLAAFQQLCRGRLCRPGCTS